MFAKAPTLAWLLTALTCFVAGMALTEGRHEAVARFASRSVGVVVTVEVVMAPVATPEPTASPTPMPAVDPSLLAPWPPPSSGSAPTPVATVDPVRQLDRLPTPASDPASGPPQPGGTGNVP